MKFTEKIEKELIYSNNQNLLHTGKICHFLENGGI
jgi:hypothetical protein